MIYKTTKAEFERFKRTFLAWQRRLGLTEWRVCFEHGRCGACGEVNANADGRVATVIMCTGLDEAKGELLGWDAANTGRHEALEFLVTNLEVVAGQRYIRPDDIVQARHALIRRLEAVFDEELTRKKA